MKELFKFFIAILLILYVIIYQIRRLIRRSKLIRKNNLTNLGTLIYGHPDIDNSFDSCLGLIDNNDLVLSKISRGNIIHIAKIPKVGVINISILDQSTFENTETWIRQSYIFERYTIAFHNKVKNSLVYLIIKWNDGKFDHETVFAYNNDNAMGSANKARNNLIRALR
ncbi:hypothetical protein HMPREF9713_01039 [Myroides odoratimimus CCUG 12700]|uniref:hypothetical protein n=1 Tax=Myroides odoratimimus TaxID=76832 RepID=UPI000352C411|nr:hypothetical protein [Myroides odoratimimus]EPH12201.1 hypothetical protein HMPREF9713_01039 [Myroides odoratimimus CCUG 12700]